MAGTRVTTAPSADLAEIRPMTMPRGAVPDSRVVWKKPDQPEDPLALGKTRIFPDVAQPLRLEREPVPDQQVHRGRDGVALGAIAHPLLVIGQEHQPLRPSSSFIGGRLPVRPSSARVTRKRHWLRATRAA